MDKAAAYRARAAESEMLARQMSREDHREQFLEDAREWRARAEVAERESRSFKGPDDALAG